MNSCNFCNKTLKLSQQISGRCKCGSIFCSVHLFSDKHKCSFDFRSSSSNEIQEKNKKIVALKIIKI